MDERQFRAFVSVVDAGRMDLAAQTLGYSQPAISYQIKCLENNLRTKLFVRNSTGAHLTSQGAMLLPTARAVVALLDTIKQTFDHRGATEPVVNMTHASARAGTPTRSRATHSAMPVSRSTAGR